MEDSIFIYTTLIMALGSLVLSASKYFKNTADEHPVIKAYKTPFYLDENGKLCRNPKLPSRKHIKYTESFINTGYTD